MRYLSWTMHVHDRGLRHYSDKLYCQFILRLAIGKQIARKGVAVYAWPSPEGGIVNPMVSFVRFYSVAILI